MSQYSELYALCFAWKHTHITTLSLIANHHQHHLAGNLGAEGLEHRDQLFLLLDQHIADLGRVDVNKANRDALWGK